VSSPPCPASITIVAQSAGRRQIEQGRRLGWVGGGVGAGVGVRRRRGFVCGDEIDHDARRPGGPG
jgi:hypothetical protein